MRQRLREARRTESGFTLVELLIVIVILGVLAGIVVFAVGAVKDRGNASACKTDVSNVQVAVDAYYAQNGKYPTQLSDLTAGSAPFLRSLPSPGPTSYAQNGYTITYVPADGSVSGSYNGTACK